MRKQEWEWSEYLSQFNLVNRFCPGKLGAKPDALTRQWNIYLKQGGNDYATVNLQNFRLIFTSKQVLLFKQVMSPAL